MAANAGGQFYRVNSSYALGGPARLLIAPYSYSHAVRIQNVIDLATLNYPPQTTTYGYTDVGSTDKPTQTDFSATTTDWKNEQEGTFKTLPTDWMAKITSSAMEQTVANKINLMLASQVTDPVAGIESRVNYVARDSFPKFHLAVMWMDQNNLIHCSVYPDVQWDGSAITQQQARGAAVLIPINFKGFPDDTLIDTPTGKAIFRYDLDQYTVPT